MPGPDRIPAAPFPVTRWSAVAAARSADPAERERALEAIAEAYWKPVYAYIRLRWRREPEDAEDLTQELFARLVEKDWLADFDPERARLRTFLRTCIDRLVANVRRDAGRERRGGGATHLSLDFNGAEGELARIEPPAAEDAEGFFAREWARHFLGLAVTALRTECERRGKQLHFRLFACYDLEDVPPQDCTPQDRTPVAARPSYADLAREHGIAATDVTNHLSWARREFRRLALARLRDLTASEHEFRLEARSLLGIEPP